MPSSICPGLKADPDFIVVSLFDRLATLLDPAAASLVLLVTLLEDFHGNLFDRRRGRVPGNIQGLIDEYSSEMVSRCSSPAELLVRLDDYSGGLE